MTDIKELMHLQKNKKDQQFYPHKRKRDTVLPSLSNEIHKNPKPNHIQSS